MKDRAVVDHASDLRKKEMTGVKCEICKKEVKSLFIVTHKDRGRIRICETCLEHEADNLMAHKSCCCS